MSELPPDAVCLTCGYALRGLPKPVCPECGRAFDPANRLTYYNSIDTWARQMQNMIRPPGRLHCGAVLITTFILLAMMASGLGRVPFRHDDEVTLAALVWLLVLPLATVDVVSRRVYVGRLQRRGLLASGRRPGRWAWLLAPICMLLVTIAMFVSPFELRLLISRPFLEYKASRVQESGRADSTPGVVGLLWVSRVAVVEGTGVKFQLGDAMSRRPRLRGGDHRVALVRDPQERLRPGTRPYTVNLALHLGRTGGWFADLWKDWFIYYW
jgi:hypothetical protein